MDKFTQRMLGKASEAIPGGDESTEQWWENRHLDEATCLTFAISIREAMPVPVSAASYITVGMMIGFELGRLYSDPSFALARELHP